MPLLASFNRVAFSIQSCRPSLAHSIGSSGMAGSQRDHLFSRRGVGHMLICVTMAWCSIGSVAADEGLVTLTKLERHSIEAGQRKINLGALAARLQTLCVTDRSQAVRPERAWQPTWKRLCVQDLHLSK